MTDWRRNLAALWVAQFLALFGFSFNQPFLPLFIHQALGLAAATALVAAETPRHRVGWALGVLSSAIALGTAVGPVAGGLAAAAFGFRATFFAGSALLLCGLFPLVLLVRESGRSAGAPKRVGGLVGLRQVARPILVAVGGPILSQALMPCSFIS